MRVGIGVAVSVGSGVLVGVGVFVDDGVTVGDSVMVAVAVLVDVRVGVDVGMRPRLSMTDVTPIQRQNKIKNTPMMIRVSLRRSGAKNQPIARNGRTRREERQQPLALAGVA